MEKPVRVQNVPFVNGAQTVQRVLRYVFLRYQLALASFPRKRSAFFRESSELHAGRKTPVLSHPVHVPAFLVVEHLQEESVSL